MYLLRGIVQLLVVKLSVIHVSSKLISFKVGRVTYEYDNDSTPLGSWVYKGIRKEGNKIEEVAFKESHQLQDDEHDTFLYNEKKICEIVSDHDSIPTFHHYFPRTNRTAVLVTELLGKTVSDLRRDFNPFSTVTVLRIGLQVLDTLEYIHKKGVLHYDLHIGNIAVGAKNNSKIYIFDFDTSRKYTPRELFTREGEAKRRDDVNLFLTNLMNLSNNKTLGEFQKGSWQTGPLDYEGIKNELRTELEKHKHEPNFDQFDWQYRTPRKLQLNNKFI